VLQGELCPEPAQRPAAIGIRQLLVSVLFTFPLLAIWVAEYG
jgi:hypothetical protein